MTEQRGELKEDELREVSGGTEGSGWHPCPYAFKTCPRTSSGTQCHLFGTSNCVDGNVKDGYDPPD